MTPRRPVAIALAASVLYSGVLVAEAHAELHYVRVTLVTGQQLTVTVDIPPGTPVSQVSIPGLPAPVASVVDLGSAEGTPTATPTVSVTLTPTPTPTSAGTATPSPSQDGNTSHPPSGGGTSGSSGGPKHQSGSGSVSDTVHKAAGNVQSLAGSVPTATATPQADQAAPQPPTPANPTYTLAPAGAAKVGVPNFFIDKFRIPPFLLPIYQAAGTEYGVRWEVLAAINEIETDYGRNLNISSAGAEGWMQFLPELVGEVRRGRQRRRLQGPRTTRSTRSSPPPATCGRPGRPPTCAARSSPTTTRAGTSTPC